MTSNPVLDNHSISKSVVQDLFRKELQDWADDDTTPLTDPHAPRDSDDAPFVVTSYPDQGLRYPHIVVDESNIVSTAFDNRRELWEHDVNIELEILARQDTEKFVLKDATRGFVLSTQGTQQSAGFADGDIAGSTASSWESDPEVVAHQLTINGTVYSSQA